MFTLTLTYANSMLVAFVLLRPNIAVILSISGYLTTAVNAYMWLNVNWDRHDITRSCALVATSVYTTDYGKGSLTPRKDVLSLIRV